MVELKLGEKDPEIKNNMKCGVCMDLFKIGDMIKITDCNHQFHKDCLIPWLK